MAAATAGKTAAAAAAVGTPAHRSAVLSLYRAILRHHRMHLSPELRVLGDGYVKSEFRLARKAEPRHAAAFVRSWHQYLDTVRQQAREQGAVVGSELEPVAVQSLSPEQQQQLEKLRAEAVSRGQQD